MPKYIVDKKGNRKSIIVSLKQYNKIKQDIHDLSIIAERREENSVLFDEMKRKFIKDE